MGYNTQREPYELSDEELESFGVKVVSPSLDPLMLECLNCSERFLRLRRRRRTAQAILALPQRLQSTRRRVDAATGIRTLENLPGFPQKSNQRTSPSCRIIFPSTRGRDSVNDQAPKTKRGRIQNKPEYSTEYQQELCTCGHPGASHIVCRHSCQAPGNHKGFCPCLRFIPQKAVGRQGLRGPGRP